MESNNIANSIIRSVPRNLEEPARIFGLSPMELASCALTYAASSALLRGIPFSAFLSLGIGIGLAMVIYVLNRTRPPLHGLFCLLSLLRNPVTPVMREEK